MSSTISQIASYYYNAYQMGSSSTTTSDSTSTFNVTNALSAVSDVEDDAYISASSAYDYSKRVMTLSQLSIYDALTSTDDTVDFNAVGTTSAYASSTLMTEALESSGLLSSSNLDSYGEYLSEMIGQTIDLGL